MILLFFLQKDTLPRSKTAAGPLRSRTPLPRPAAKRGGKVVLCLWKSVEIIRQIWHNTMHKIREARNEQNESKTLAGWVVLHAVSFDRMPAIRIGARCADGESNRRALGAGDLVPHRCAYLHP